MKNDALKSLAKEFCVRRNDVVTVELQEVDGACKSRALVPLFKRMVPGDADCQGRRQGHHIFFIGVRPKVSRSRARTFQEANVS
jgi:hypothetical protein